MALESAPSGPLTILTASIILSAAGFLSYLAAHALEKMAAAKAAVLELTRQTQKAQCEHDLEQEKVKEKGQGHVQELAQMQAVQQAVAQVGASVAADDHTRKIPPVYSNEPDQKKRER